MKLQELLEKNILEIANIQDADQKEKEEFLEKMSEAALARVLERIKNKLSPEKWREFELLLKDDTKTAELNRFLEESVPEFARLLVEETAGLKNEAFGYFAKL